MSDIMTGQKDDVFSELMNDIDAASKRLQDAQKEEQAKYETMKAMQQALDDVKTESEMDILLAGIAGENSLSSLAKSDASGRKAMMAGELKKSPVYEKTLGAFRQAERNYDRAKSETSQESKRMFALTTKSNLLIAKVDATTKGATWLLS